MTDNNDRAKWADESVKVFMKATGTDECDAAADLIANLLHWCDKHDQDPLIQLKRAIRMYMDERDYPPDGWAPEGLLLNVEIITSRGPIF